MTSESLFRPCPKCGTPNHLDSGKCGKCGTQLKKKSRILYIAIGISALIVIAGRKESSPVSPNRSADSSLSSNYPSSKEKSLPLSQLRFVDITIEHREHFQKAINEIQQSQARERRKLDFERLFANSLMVAGWVGSIADITTTTDGMAAISINIADRIQLKTWNNKLSDLDSQTLISKDSDLYRYLSDLKQGDEVIFSGTLLKSRDDHVNESSLTIEGSMNSPEFIIKFTNIKRL